MIKIMRPDCPYPQALENKDYKHPNNKSALIKASHGKCMYCESKVSHIYFGDIEHIKPKTKDKFPELEFVWENHGFCCAICNNNKSDKYLTDCPFIDPYFENPELHFFFAGSFIFKKNGCERAEYTINEIDLNRPELLEKRMESISAIESLISASHRIKNEVVREKAAAEIDRYASNDREFSMCIKSFIFASRL
ncbi:HNH endonuclease [Cellvibrio sp. QJXJ]|uniref:HNH endonuclease n=1 Tax=Cellvibrio sp. QJXJ TaxID=2964606 RepID=UPI0021C2A848|nr:HNH endonuclease [Cellvibrio sp. QJXJ]UUA72565.1 HNH endonuclease [Cellvibrio sp. QJXJ]